MENIYERTRALGERLNQAVARALQNDTVQDIMQELESIGASAAIDILVQPPSYKTHGEALIKQFQEVRQLEQMFRLEDRREP